MKKPDPKIQRLMSAIAEYMADSNNLGGVTMRSITADLLTGPVQAREALTELGATEIAGKWHLPQDDEPAPAKPVAVPTPVKPIIVREEKQAVEAPKVIVTDVPPLVVTAPEPVQPAPAALIKEPRVTVKTRMIALFEDHPDGITKEDAADALGVTMNSFKSNLMDLRKETQVDLIERDGKKLYIMRDDLAPAPAPAQEIEMQQPEQVQQPVSEPVAAQPEPVQQPNNLEGWVFIDESGAFKTAPRPSAAQAIAAMELLGQREIDSLMKAEGLRLAKVRVVTDVLFVMGAVA